MIRGLSVSAVALAMFLPAGDDLRITPDQSRDAKQLVAELRASDPVVRTRAACDLRELGDGAADAIDPLIALLDDASPVEPTVCERRWWRGSNNDLTTPGEQAASALVAIGSRAFSAVLAVVQRPAWVARKNAAWALGALDDPRAVKALIDLVRDREPQVREQAAWALGALDDPFAVPALVNALKDDNPRVRRQAAWALGAIDDSRAVQPLIQ